MLSTKPLQAMRLLCVSRSNDFLRRYLKEILEELSPELHSAFLVFVTGASRACTALARVQPKLWL